MPNTVLGIKQNIKINTSLHRLYIIPGESISNKCNKLLMLESSKCYENKTVEDNISKYIYKNKIKQELRLKWDKKTQWLNAIGYSGFNLGIAKSTLVEKLVKYELSL